MSNNPKRVEGARTKAATTGSVGTVANIKIGGEWKFSKKPAYIKERIVIWDELFAAQNKKYEGKFLIKKTRRKLYLFCICRFPSRSYQDHNA